MLNEPLTVMVLVDCAVIDPLMVRFLKLQLVVLPKVLLVPASVKVPPILIVPVPVRLPLTMAIVVPVIVLPAETVTLLAAIKLPPVVKVYVSLPAKSKTVLPVENNR